VRLAQEVAALHLAAPGLLDDLHDLSPVLVPGRDPEEAATRLVQECGSQNGSLSSSMGGYRIIPRVIAGRSQPTRPGQKGT
jgi:hypothetical protein